MPSDVWTAKSTGMPNFTRTASPRCLPGVHFGDLPMTRQYLVRKGFIGRFEYFGIAHRAVLLDDERDQDFPVNVFAEGFRRVFHVHLYPPAKLADVAAVELRRGIHHQERLFPGAFVFTGLSVLCRSSYSEINGQRISHTHLFAALFARFPFGRSCDDAPRLFRECLARRLKYLDIAYRAVLFDDERQYDTPLFPVPECLRRGILCFSAPMREKC